MGDIINPATLPEPAERYVLGTCLGAGIFGQVYEATDKEAGGKKVAVKIQTVTRNSEKELLDEYNILKEFCPSHSNLVDFYGIFCDKSESVNKIWFVMEVLLFFYINVHFFIFDIITCDIFVVL